VIRVPSTFANGVSLCGAGRASLITSSTSQPLTPIASEMSERWQRHHSSSEHIIAVRERSAKASSLAMPSMKAAVCM